MRVGSLFAGIGGFDLAARWMGWETAWFSEIDPYASAVLAKHWPGVPNHGDITRIDFTKVNAVDVVCGGFPCQDISTAGKGVGIDGERSGLWREYARAIGELRPRYVVVENSPALLGRGLDRVLGDLAAIGYDAEWTVLSAADIGAPHLRQRCWIVAYPADPVRRADARSVAGREREGGREAGGRRVREGLRLAQHDGLAASGEALDNAVRVGLGGIDGRHDGEGRRDDAAEGHAPVEHASRVGWGEGRAEPVFRRGWFAPARTGSGFWSDGEWQRGADDSVRYAKPGVRVLDHGIPRRVDRIRCLGNAIVPQIAHAIFRAIEAHEVRLSRAA